MAVDPTLSASTDVDRDSYNFGQNVLYWSSCKDQTWFIQRKHDNSRMN